MLLVNTQIAKAYELMKPAYVYELKSIEEVSGQNVFLEGCLVFSSMTVSYALSDCCWAAIYLATIGSGLEEQVSEMMKKGEMLKALVLDAVGSEAVVQVSYKLQDAIRAVARAKGCQVTIKYSPGYCDWDVRQQNILFSAIDSTSVSVNLLESCMMTPRKSVSGIIGIGNLNRGKPPPCLAVCKQRESCTHKRVGCDPEKQLLL
jgi:hypothetical protein